MSEVPQERIAKRMTEYLLENTLRAQRIFLYPSQ